MESSRIGCARRPSNIAVINCPIMKTFEEDEMVRKLVTLYTLSLVLIMALPPQRLLLVGNPLRCEGIAVHQGTDVAGEALLLVAEESHHQILPAA